MKSIMKYAIKSYNRIPLKVLIFFAPVYNLLPDSIRFTKVFSKEWNNLNQISKMPEDVIHEETEKKIQEIIMYSYKHVPYYKALFDRIGLNPSSIKTKEDLQQIPFLTKEEMLAHEEELISDEFNKNDLIYITTSGTTGIPAGFYVEKDSHMRDWAYMYYAFKEFGLTPKSKKLVLRGKVFREQKKGKKYQWDAFKRELSVNIFSMNDECLEEYCYAIEKYKPDFAYGYISAMYVLCKYIKRRGGINHVFKGFISISENIVDEQRYFIENILNIPVLTFYGMSERVIWATERYCDKKYVVAPLYGVVELVDKNGNVISNYNETGELVGTGLLNFGMPLIRYKTGDISSWHDEGVLNNIEGRWNYDQLVANDGSLISMTALNMHSEVFKNVIRYQMYQTIPGEVTIRVVPSKNYSIMDRTNILRQFQMKTGKSIKYKCEEVSSIQPNKNGKLSIVNQNIKL